MKTVSYDLELKLTETARKHGVVLPASYKYYNGFDKNSLCIPDNERTFGLRGFTVKNVDTGECVSISDDCNAIKTHTADELMDWFRTFLRIEISACNDLYYVYPNKSFLKMSDLLTIGDTVKSNETLADALAQMAIWLIENGYVK